MARMEIGLYAEMEQFMEKLGTAEMNRKFKCFALLPQSKQRLTKIVTKELEELYKEAVDLKTAGLAEAILKRNDLKSFLRDFIDSFGNYGFTTQKNAIHVYHLLTENIKCSGTSQNLTTLVSGILILQGSAALNTLQFDVEGSTLGLHKYIAKEHMFDVIDRNDIAVLGLVRKCVTFDDFDSSRELMSFFQTNGCG
eukprot:TRINITY_DN3299_c0_g1_i2.p1 TRINITY_DN3299_c0_g1~~TRINITY_DN3299_c0_g1_i2.p1  ORF type:complete len:196 (-),score=42.64 TRINITY_DN3299_c0_g1_i2:460-1047(-)